MATDNFATERQLEYIWQVVGDIWCTKLPADIKASTTCVRNTPGMGVKGDTGEACYVVFGTMMYDRNWTFIKNHPSL